MKSGGLFFWFGDGEYVGGVVVALLALPAILSGATARFPSELKRVWSPTPSAGASKVAATATICACKIVGRRRIFRGKFFDRRPLGRVCSGVGKRTREERHEAWLQRRPIEPNTYMVRKPGKERECVRARALRCSPVSARHPGYPRLKCSGSSMWHGWCPHVIGPIDNQISLICP